MRIHIATTLVYGLQNKTKQNKTKQNKTKQNKTKQNRTKQTGQNDRSESHAWEVGHTAPSHSQWPELFEERSKE